MYYQNFLPTTSIGFQFRRLLKQETVNNNLIQFYAAKFISSQLFQIQIE